MNEQLKKKPPFAWIDYKNPEEVKKNIEIINAYKGLPILSIDNMPKEALLSDWINEYPTLYFHVKANDLVPKDLDNLITIAQRRVFFEGLKAYELEERLLQGSSIIIGSDTIGIDNITYIYKNKPVGRNIWIDSRGFRPGPVIDLLDQGIKMVFSPISAHRFSESSIYKFIDTGKQNAIIHAYDYTPDVLKDFLKRGATLLFLGDTEYMAPRYILELYNESTDEEQKRIHVILKNGTADRIQDMTDQLLEICIAEDKIEAFLFA